MSDALKNLAISAVAVAPSPASSGTSLTVTTGQGTRFPAVSFNAVVWPSGSVPTPANAEIVRVTNIATDVFTITRAQEGTSARSIIVGDQIAQAITAKTFSDLYATMPAVAPFLDGHSALCPNAKVVNIFGSNLPTGDNDLYTVPAGRRAVLLAVPRFYNPSAGSIVIYLEFKLGGTYRRATAAATLTTGTGSNNPWASGAPVGFILEAGEKLSVNTATTAGLNVWGAVLEFDNTSNARTVYVAAPASGDNTIYTVPAGKMAQVRPSHFNASGGSLNLTHYYVPSGGSKGTTNQASPATALADVTLLNNGIGSADLSAGDFVVVNWSGAGTNSLSWVTVIEYAV